MVIGGLSQRQMQPVRRSAQMIFQDPYASLDPRMAVGAAIAKPLIIHGLDNKGERDDRVTLICCAGSACNPTPPAVTRTSFPAASASASTSPGP